MSEIIGFIEVFPILPAIYTAFLYYCISKIPKKWVQLVIPPFLILILSIMVIYLNEFGVLFFYTAIAMGIITPFLLIEKYFLLKWKFIVIGICAFMTYLLVTIIAFSYAFEGVHPLIELFPPLGFFHSLIIHYLEAILIATVSYGYLLGLERFIYYIGKKFR